MTKVKLVEPGYMPEEESLHIITYATLGLSEIHPDFQGLNGISDDEYNQLQDDVNSKFIIRTHEQFSLTLLPQILLKNKKLEQILPTATIIKMMLELWALRKQYKEKNVLLIISNQWNEEITALHHELSSGKGFQIPKVKNLYIWTLRRSIYRSE